MLNHKENPYPNGNHSLMLDYLEEVVKRIGGESGLYPISAAFNGYQDSSFFLSPNKTLNSPEQAVAALIYIEAPARLLDSPILIRYKLNGEAPNVSSGFPGKDGDKIFIRGRENILAFRAIGLQQAAFLRVQYFENKSASMSSSSSNDELPPIRT